MSLTVVPSVERLLLAVVEAVPEWHPEHATFQPFPVYAWLLRHPDGPILVDSGVGIGHTLIDEWYRPRITAIGDALGAVEIDVNEVVGLVLSHLHFDHCGQQAAFDCPVYVQAAEYDAAQRPTGTRSLSGRRSRRTVSVLWTAMRRSPRGSGCWRRPATRRATSPS